MTENKSNVFSVEDISAVVCTLNEEERINDCLMSLRDAGVGEIILVDGRSNDKTIQIASKYTKNIYFDDGYGLGAARNIGINKASKKLILNFGADNSINKEALEIMLSYIMLYNGVSCLTAKNGSNYLNRCINKYRYLRYRSGLVNTIGTPSLFSRDLLLKFPFDDTRKASDDSELCERLREMLNCKFYISPAHCDENGVETLKTVRSRWRNIYGRSDFENFENNKYKWTLYERFTSLLYPLKNEFLMPILRIREFRQLEVIPFLVCITVWRYSGWWMNKYVK